MKCNICDSQSATQLSVLYDDRYGYPGLFPVMLCPSCGHKMLDARFTPDQLTELYTKYYPRSSFSLDTYKPYSEISVFKGWLSGAKSFAFRWVPENVRVLDIGCGFGETLGYHKARGCDVYGVEADENIRRVAEKFGYKVHVGLFDPTVYESDYFDYVTLDQVIEHTVEPLAILKDIASVMKKGGRLLVSTPNASGWGSKMFGKYWIHWHTPYHLQFFSQKSIRIAAEKAGFDVIRVKTVTDSYWLIHQLIHLVTRPNLEQPSSYWGANVLRTRFQKNIMKVALLIHRVKINHIITRFFDLMCVGDNYLFFMQKK